MTVASMALISPIGLAFMIGIRKRHRVAPPAAAFAARGTKIGTATGGASGLANSARTATSESVELKRRHHEALTGPRRQTCLESQLIRGR